MSYRLTAGMTYRLPALSTPAMKGANQDQLRVLLSLSQSGYTLRLEAIAKQCGISLTCAATALDYWLENGVIEPLDTPSLLVDDSLLHGSAADDARVIREEELHGCLDSCAQILGKLLNPAEINVLVAILNDLGASEAYLTTLLDFCVNKMGKKSLRYLEKTAIGLFDGGITTVEALDEYIRRYERVHSKEGQVRRLWGMGERAFSASEESYLNSWFNEYGYDMDIIGIAYDITVNNTGKAPLRYAHKLLTLWHQNGLKTVADVETYLEAQKKNAPKARTSAPKKQPLATSSFDITSAFELALERSYGDTEKKG